MSNPPILLKNKSIWRSNGDKSTKYIQFKIYVVSIDILSHDSTPISDVYMVTMRRHRKTFSTTAMPAVKYTENKYYVVFDQSFLLPANMIYINDTVRAKYAVLTIQHKEKNWSNSTNFTFDAEVYLPLHEFYLDANKSLMMPKDISYPFTVGKNEYRMNIHVDMKEIDAEPNSRSIRSLGSSASFRDLTDFGKRSRSNSTSSESSFLSNSSFASFGPQVPSMNPTPAASPAMDADKLLNSRNSTGSIRSVNIKAMKPPANDPRLKHIMQSFPIMDDHVATGIAESKENIKPEVNCNAAVDEMDYVTHMNKEKEKVEEVVREFMTKKKEFKTGSKDKFIHTNRRHLSIDPVADEPTPEPQYEEPVTDIKAYPALTLKKNIVTLLLASLCMLVILSSKSNPVMDKLLMGNRYIYQSIYPSSSIPKEEVKPVFEEPEPIKRNNTSSRAHSTRQENRTALIDVDDGRHLPRLLRAISRFLQRFNPIRMVGNFVRKIQGKDIVPAPSDKKAFE